MRTAISCYSRYLATTGIARHTAGVGGAHTFSACGCRYASGPLMIPSLPGPWEKIVPRSRSIAV